jgi:hypothetical protein
MQTFQNLQDASAAWAGDRRFLAEYGIHMDEVQGYMPESWKRDVELAMDEAPALTTSPNAAIPSILTTYIDPTVIEVLFSPLTATEIVAERREGNWVMDTVMFMQVERTGEVSSYGDFSENGMSGANTNFPQRQNYIFQTIVQYGDRELERAGLAKLNWASEQNKAAAWAINNFQNLSYFYGIKGLENFGLINQPGLSAPLTPALKAAGGNAWIQDGVVVATANEIYDDLLSMFIALVEQSGGLIKMDSELIVALSPKSQAALAQVNSFNVDVADLLKKNFPKIRFVTAIQYGAKSTANPQGNVGGELVQMYCPTVEGQKTAITAYSEKMKTLPLIRAMSSYRQKMYAGTWGAVIFQPFAVSQMLGV